jgi:hypothetical protein
MELNVVDLLVDEPGLREAWAARLEELDIVDELGEPGEGDRREIREAMLDDDQLDAENHPVIRIRLLGLSEGDTQAGSEHFPFDARVAFTIRGVTVEQAVPARYVLIGNELQVEAVGELTFESFGIEPYSAFLGSVKNQNEFDVYLFLRAVR